MTSDRLGLAGKVHDAEVEPRHLFLAEAVPVPFECDVQRIDALGGPVARPVRDGLVPLVELRHSVGRKLNRQRRCGSCGLQIADGVVDTRTTLLAEPVPSGGDVAWKLLV